MIQHFEVPTPIATTRPAGETLAYERGETEQLLGTRQAAKTTEIDRTLELDRESVLLRRLSDGKVGLLANLPQDVTHISVTVTSPSGASRTIEVPKDADLEAVLGLGKLADGTKVSVTPLKKDGTNVERGPALEVTWSLKTKPSPDLASYAKELEAILSDADKLGPEGIAARLSALGDRFNALPRGDHLYLWSDAGTATRHRMHEVVKELAARHPDLRVPFDGGSYTLGESVDRARQAEEIWQKQADDLTAKLRAASG
jgi:hypothetical protein